jgi:hypothetical protein
MDIIKTADHTAIWIILGNFEGQNLCIFIEPPVKFFSAGILHRCSLGQYRVKAGVVNPLTL